MVCSNITFRTLYRVDLVETRRAWWRRVERWTFRTLYRVDLVETDYKSPDIEAVIALSVPSIGSIWLKLAKACEKVLARVAFRTLYRVDLVETFKA